ncbi:MAG: sugar phosphate isomerase/epimerase, partial [Armatimonadota bacterium]|nr:sugar phosphate isomerase/epimerase [Armatimonadota bacterium]
MYTGYHNHTVEFTPLDGELPWDTFFGNTRHEVVMQLDTGNALEGGADPTPFLSRYPGRALTVHLKEHSTSDPNALVGEGDIHWPTIFALCEGQGGTQWYIVEQESYAHPPLECVDRCLQNLRKMGKA